MEKENYLENPYFFISTKAGKQLLGRIKTDGRLNVMVDDETKKVVIDYFVQSDAKFIKLINVYEIQLARIGGDVKPIPVQYNQTATGSDVILLAIDSIEMINAIDENSELAKAIRSIGTGIIPSATENDVQQSSKLIHKFAAR